jgi:hypothetical protein
MGRNVPNNQPDVAPNWEHLTPFFAYPADIRKVIYTTNAVESLNMSLRKVIKTRGVFPEPGSSAQTAVSGSGAHCQKVDHAGAELEGRLAALRDSAGRSRSKDRNDVNNFHYEQSEEEYFWDGGSALYASK